MRLEYNGGIVDARVDVLVIAISQHYRLARRLVKEACSSKAKAVRMTDEEAAAGRYLSDVILKYGGRTIGAYCRECFEKATTGLDLRSYKLKFALIRLRDSLKAIPAHRDIAKRMDFLVEFAERLAGCVPDEKRRGKSSKRGCGKSIGPLFEGQDHMDMPVLSVSIPGFDSVMPTAKKEQDSATDAKKAKKSHRDKSYEKLSSYILSHADKDPEAEDSVDSGDSGDPGDSDEDVEECQEDKEQTEQEQHEQPEQYQQEEEE